MLWISPDRPDYGPLRPLLPPHRGALKPKFVVWPLTSVGHLEQGHPAALHHRRGLLLFYGGLLLPIHLLWARRFSLLTLRGRERGRQ
jgi:hypothetical protein